MIGVRIYFEHNGNEVMEIQNWETWTDSGAVVMRWLNPSECQTYFNLKRTLNMRDMEIWRVFHPVSEDSSLIPPSGTKTKKDDAPLPHPSPKVREIKISTRELSKRALLHIIWRSCGSDIERLKEFTREELLTLASGILPADGVPVRVMPRLAA